MRSKEIDNLKRGIKLTKIQRSIIVGLILGDGHLETQDGGRTYRLKVEHSIKQKDYVDWLYAQLENLVSSIPKLKIKNLAGKEYISYWFTTYSLGEFRFYAQKFYSNGKKVIPKFVFKLLDPLAIAIWFMDDGSFKSVRHRTFIIHTLGYSKKDLLLIKEVFRSKFGIDLELHRQKRNSFRLYVLSKSADDFKALVNPYIIPVFRYKLGEHMPKK